MRSTTRRLAAALLASLALLAPAGLSAACQGRDLAQGWSPEFTAEIEAMAAGAPHAEGRLFEVEKDGARSVLFGTIHLPIGAVGPLPGPLAEAVPEATEVLIEITRTEEKRMMGAIAGDPGLVLAPGGRSLRDALTPEEFAVLEPLLPAYGLTPAIAERLQPWYLAITLGNPACLMRPAPGSGPILDRAIEAAAETAGVTVTGLERFEDLFVLFGRLDYDTQVGMLRAGLPTFVDAEDSLETTRRMYVAGEVQKIRAYGLVEMRRSGPEAQDAAQTFFDILLAERNRRWMETLLPKLREGGRVVAVGALHLGGADGLLAALEAEGFAVRRLPE